MEKLREDILSAYALTMEKQETRRSPQETVELETRVGVVGYDTGTKHLLWSNAYVTMRKQAVKRTSSRYTTETLSEGHISFRLRNGKWQIKTSSCKYDNYDVYMRVEVSIESPSRAPTEAQKHGKTLGEKTLRHISRDSFYMNNSARVDFSHVLRITGKEIPVVSFEVEVEYLHGKNSSLLEYTQTVIDVYMAMFQTPLPFTYSNLCLACEEANIKLLSSPAYSNKMISKLTRYVDRSFFSEARALDLNSMSVSRLFGRRGTGVVISPKTDGDRLFLIVTRVGCFGMYPPSRVALYADNDYTRSSKLTILDTELYNGVLYYIDALVIDGDDCRHETYMNRMVAFKEWNKGMSVNTIGIEIRTKPMVLLTENGFFADLKAMYESLNLLDFQSDGIMFTPNDVSYVDSTGEIPVIMKWKPEITIDLRVNNGKVYYTDSVTGADVEFLGSQKSPLKRITMGDIVPVQGSIVEFDIKDYGLVAMRPRLEKIGPNTDKTALDNWEKATIDYVSPEALLGETNELMRKYHNRLKSGLFAQGRGVLLDIGSGRGGDIAKWKNYDMVLCVEPDEKNIKEFHSRLSKEKTNVREKIHILQARGQDTKAIRDFVTKHLGRSGTVDVVSMMDSLTFFFDGESLEHLKSTINKCLKPSGLFLWKALDGRMVKKAMQRSDKLSFGLHDSLTKGEGEYEGRLHVNIVPHVVDVHEYYTDIDTLMTTLEMKGTVLHATAEDELIKDDYKVLSTMYAYSTFTYTNTTIIPDGVVKILFGGVHPPDSFEFLEAYRHPTIIGAIEGAFTQEQHSVLLGNYYQMTLAQDTSYIPTGTEKPYTHFETANYGYLAKRLLGELPKNEREVFASLNPEDVYASLTFASLLGIDVYVIPENMGDDYEVLYTNRVRGSIRPIIQVVESEEGYWLSENGFSLPVDPADDLNDPEFDMAEVIREHAPADLKLDRQLVLSTPILERVAHTDGADVNTRLMCVANYIAGSGGQVVSPDVLEIYGIDEVDSQEAIDYISSVIEFMNTNN